MISNSDKSQYQSLKALVVDDQEFVLKIVSTMLNGIGFGEIITSTDGTEALASVESSKPDLIICDINMKPMDGLSFVRKLGESDNPNVKNIPLIFLTAETNQDIVAQATELGCDAFLLKPVSPEKLSIKIDQVFGSGDIFGN